MTHNGPFREDIVAMTRDWLGTPYVHQASTKRAGTDCLGLVRGIWRELYGHEAALVPAYTPDWTERAGDELLLKAAETHLRRQPAGSKKPGDVILFRVVPGGPVKHMGILSAQDRFIHAYAGRQVCESWLGRWWAVRSMGTFSFPGVDE